MIRRSLGAEGMPQAQGEEAEKARILLGLLESVERDSAKSQRHLADELGIALGLVNAYLKRCIKKGLIKMKEAPARRYAYYLTPRGFSEKSRLTVEYLSSSFSFFRRARGDCCDVLAVAQACGWKRIALAGVSDLAEIATICALERGVEIVAVVDARSTLSRFVSLPVHSAFEQIGAKIDGVIVTDLTTASTTFAAVAARFGHDRVLAPSLLGLRKSNEAA
jgi:DNA-binding MarR family transcriptional regulator